MSSYTFEIFWVEKYGSSALKCRVGRLHTTLSKFFTFKSKIYMKKPQNVAECNISGYPDGLSTSNIYVVDSQIQIFLHISTTWHGLMSLETMFLWDTI